jgi:glutamate---cysteine ligase / carboxylate-amine ligase
MKLKLPLFSAYGIELEYMIVNNRDLSVSPISDKLIFDVAGQFQNEVQFDKVAWSNELVLHVLELKTNGPAQDLQPLANHFQNEISKINNLLKKYDAKLLPTGAHPWMDPYKEIKLWPHGSSVIYDTYHKIFNCLGHGWSNLQSAHLNLPFADDLEFSKLHTAIRLILPIIPAISASTPIVEGKLTSFLDTRLEYYRLNQDKIPSIAGDIIPELVLSEKEYNEKILDQMYRAISYYDPDKVLQQEWLNSRGAIARFERNTIEIRIIDTQECPKADLAIINLIVATLKSLLSERWCSFPKQTTWSSKRLSKIFLETIKEGMCTHLDDEYLSIFNYTTKTASARDLWQHILNEVSADPSLSIENTCILATIIDKGNLAERIVSSLKNESQREIKKVYQELAHCLDTGELYLP